MADLIFISFSKEYAGKVALELQSLIRNIFGESIETFTSQNIVSGDWSEEIHEKISQSKYAISVLSPENMKNAPWLMYEAGAIVMSVGDKKKSLSPFLFCRHISDLESPLKRLQAMSYHSGINDNFNKEQMFNLMKAVNNALTTKIPEHLIKHVFDTKWEDLSSKLNQIATDMFEKSSWRNGIETQNNKPILTNSLVTYHQSDISFGNCDFYPKTPRQIENYFEKILKNIPQDWKILDTQKTTEDAHRVIIGENTRISTFVSFTDGKNILILDRKNANSRKINVENPKLDVFGAVQFENRSLSLKIPIDSFLDSQIIKIEPIYGIAIEENRPKDKAEKETVVMMGINIYMKTEDLIKALNEKDIQLYPIAVLNAQINDLTSKAHLAVMSLVK